MEAIVNIFLNDIQALLYRADQIVSVNFNAHAGHVSLIAQSLQKRAVAAAQIQHVAILWHPVKHRIQVQTVHGDGPTRFIHSDNSRS